MSAQPENAADSVTPLPGRGSAAASGSFYRPELDVLRFFAFFSVFIYHSVRHSDPSLHSGIHAFVTKLEIIITEGGGFGVSLFFLLSSYLITELLIREQERTGTIHRRAFYLRRILRIWPLYFLMLGLGYGFGLLAPDSAFGTGRLFAFLLLAGNWYAMGHGATPGPSGPLWSIPVEEQFYLVWPSLARRGATWLTAISIGVIPLSLVAIEVLVRLGAREWIWTNSFVQFQYFGLGALLALWMRRRTPNLGAGVRAVLLCSGMGLWLVASGFFHILSPKYELTVPVWQLMAGYGTVAAGCLCLFLGFLGAPRRWLPGALIYLGKISYGLYMFHEWALRLASECLPYLGSWLPARPAVQALVVAMRNPVGLAVTIVLAYLSYRFFETPFLRIKERFTFVPSRRI